MVDSMHGKNKFYIMGRPYARKPGYVAADREIGLSTRGLRFTQTHFIIGGYDQEESIMGGVLITV